jgi:hypothetical protein
MGVNNNNMTSITATLNSMHVKLSNYKTLRKKFTITKTINIIHRFTSQKAPKPQEKGSSSERKNKQQLQQISYNEQMVTNEMIWTYFNLGNNSLNYGGNIV